METKKLEIRYDDPETKRQFKEIAASFKNYEETLKELIRVYKLPGRVVTQKIPGGIS
jgi:TusA-related sulfurtransferase